jgi:hypothetical protein
MQKLVVFFGNFVNKLENGKRYRKKTQEWIATGGLENGAGLRTA